MFCTGRTTFSVTFYVAYSDQKCSSTHLPAALIVNILKLSFNVSPPRHAPAMLFQGLGVLSLLIGRIAWEQEVMKGFPLVSCDFAILRDRRKTSIDILICA